MKILEKGKIPTELNTALKLGIRKHNESKVTVISQMPSEFQEVTERLLVMERSIERMDSQIITLTTENTTLKRKVSHLEEERNDYMPELEGLIGDRDTWLNTYLPLMKKLKTENLACKSSLFDMTYITGRSVDDFLRRYIPARIPGTRYQESGPHRELANLLAHALKIEYAAKLWVPDTDYNVPLRKDEVTFEIIFGIGLAEYELWQTDAEKMTKNYVAVILNYHSELTTNFAMESFRQPFRRWLNIASKTFKRRHMAVNPEEMHDLYYNLKMAYRKDRSAAIAWWGKPQMLNDPKLEAKKSFLKYESTVDQQHIRDLLEREVPLVREGSRSRSSRERSCTL